MPPTTIREAPKEDIFTTLAEHQTQTPSTFYNAKPVLHYQKNGIRAIASVDQISKLPILAQPESADGATTVQTLDVWISSENLTLFNPTLSTGLSIPYPSISLHAIQRLSDSSTTDSTQIQGLYMQLDLSDPNSSGNGGHGNDNEMDEDTDQTVELTLLTTASSSDQTPTQTIQAMFDAVSACSNLHPDPSFDDDEEMQDGGGDNRIVFEGSVGYEGISGLPGVQMGVGEGGLPPPFPGSGGWITAENVGEYFDAEGNWIKDGQGEGEGEGEALGEGAGRVRGREEAEGINGHKEDAEEDSKRVRTE